MKILFVSQYYYPEPFRTTTIAEALRNMGHEVDVYCQIPSYPIGKWYKGYSFRKNRNEVRNEVNIRRSYAFARTQNMFLRLFNYYSFPHFAKKDLRKNKKEYDVVFAIQLSPVMGIEPAIYFAKRNNLKLVVYSMDMWPASILTGGIKKDGFIYKHFQKKSKKIYGSIDSLIVSSEPHIDYIKELLGDDIDISYLPQFSTDVEEAWNPDRKNQHLIWVGNIGKVQDLKTILLAAKDLENENLTIDIVGNGSELNSNKKLADSLGLKNVIFHGRLEQKELSPLLSNSIAGIVSSTDDEVSRLTLPAKVQTYLKNGLPIISSAPGATNNLIEENKCGLTANTGDVYQISENIKKLLKASDEELGLYSTNAKNLYYSTMDISYFMKTIEAALSKNSK